jgi:hypothetical protein
MKTKSTIVRDEIITNNKGCNLNLSLYARLLKFYGKSESEIKERIETIRKEIKLA